MEAQTEQTPARPSFITILHYAVAALLFIGIAGYWYLQPGGISPISDPRAAKAMALVQTHQAHQAPTLLQALNQLAQTVEDRGKGVRIGEWTVEHLQDDYYRVQVWVREEGFRQWFERDFAWQVDLNKGRVMPLSDFAAQLMPRGERPPQPPEP